MSYEEYRDCYPEREVYDLHREHLTDAELEEDAARIRANTENLRVARELGIDAESAVLMNLEGKRAEFEGNINEH